MFKTELEFVEWLQTLTSKKSSGLRLGIGDDAALVSAGRNRDFILTTDLSIEGVHFDRRLHPARSVGHRALARSLSDIAAMGGVPRFALLSIAFARGTSRTWVEEFFKGLLGLARRFQVEVIGGDTAVVARAGLMDVTVVGEVPRGKALRRSGARPGDQVYVSGRLGRSALGLRTLKSRARNRLRAALPAVAGGAVEAAIEAHLYPEPRCELGTFLRRSRLTSALMDISDGLSIDLTRLCKASKVGVEMDAAVLLRQEGEDLVAALVGSLDGRRASVHVNGLDALSLALLADRPLLIAEALAEKLYVRGKSGRPLTMRGAKEKLQAK